MPGKVRTFVRLVIPFAALVLVGQGCISVRGGGKGPDGGVYRSADRGDNWVRINAVPQPRGVGSIAGLDLITFAFDPQDPKAVYIGTAANGMYYSYDGGAGWAQAGGVAAGRVPAIAVSPRDKCTIFAATGSRVLKSTDCNRTYQTSYTDTREGVTITSLVIDWFNPRQVYAATSKGDLIRSADEGGSWALVHRFEDGIQKIIMSSKDSRTLLVGLKTNGLARSTDAGATWTEIKKQLGAFSGSRTFYDLEEVRTVDNAYILASKFGLLWTADAGDTWSKLETLTPPGSAVIYSLAVSAKDGRHIYYTTANTLYRSLDGGATWTPKKLPSGRAGTALAVDPNEGNVIYLGGTTIKK